MRGIGGTRLINRDLQRQAVITALLCVVASIGVPPAWADAQPACGDSNYGDIVISELVGLCSTADDEQRNSIRSVLRAGHDSRQPATLTVDYPLDESVFPPEIIPPTFLWHDASTEADRWVVDVAFDSGSSHIYILVRGAPPPRGKIDPRCRCVSITNEIYEPTPHQASAKSWKPSPELWAAIKTSSVAKPASFTFLGYKNAMPESVLSRGRMQLSTSRDPVGAPIFYRDVPLMPSATKDGVIKPLDQSSLPLITWRLRDISRTESRAMLTGMPTCANCHSFSIDGKTMGMDVDGPSGDKGAYALARVEPRVVIGNDQVMTWNAFKEKQYGDSLGFLSRVSPDGRYVMSTVNDAVFVRNFTDHKFLQVFYPTRGILAYYTRETEEITAFPGADDPDYVHVNPVWSPDGKTLVFCRAKAMNPYSRSRPVATFAGDPNETPIQYDLHRIPFNAGKGGRAEPIVGASNNGMSNSFPKISPDGKWIVWVQSRNGLLMRPDGKLWIVPLAGGEPRLMRCNTRLMNSWHTFSPNGRWMAFSSKSNTPYTQMFLTHIDDKGNDTPAVLIENSTAANRAVNIPEFVNVSYDKFAEITVPAVQYYGHFKRGKELAKAGQREEAVAELEKALEGEAQDWRLNDWRIHGSLSELLLQAGETEQAMQHIYESLKRNPYNAESHANLSYILFERGDLKQARQHLDIVIQLAPNHSKARYNRGNIRLTVGDSAGAVEDYTEAIRLDADYSEAYNGRGIALTSEGDPRRFQQRDSTRPEESDSVVLPRADPQDERGSGRSRAGSEKGSSAGPARHGAAQRDRTTGP